MGRAMLFEVAEVLAQWGKVAYAGKGQAVDFDYWTSLWGKKGGKNEHEKGSFKGKGQGKGKTQCFGQCDHCGDRGGLPEPVPQERGIT